MLQTYVAVAVGSAIGGCLRFGISRYFLAHSATQTSLYLGTLTVNLIGSCLMGMGIAYLHKHGANTATSFVLVGVLGGFTTFSSFSGEVLQFIQQKAYLQSFTYASGSVIFGLLFAMLGYWLFSNL